MRYQKGMKRYSKAGGKFVEDEAGEFYKGSDNKMYKGKFKAPGTSAHGDTAGQDDDHAHDEGEEVKGKKAMKKSELDAVLDEVEAMYKAADPANRKEELLQKAGSGELSEDERDELYKALGGEGDELAEPETFGDEIVKAFDDNETLQKSLDVSEYLDEQHQELVKSLSAIGERIESGERRSYELQITLAKAIHQIGTLTKAVSERLGVIERQPARQPKAAGVNVPARGQTMEKGFAGETAPGENLSKSEILDTLDDMMKSATSEEVQNAILGATAEYEQLGTISKGMYAQVIDHRRNHAH